MSEPRFQLSIAFRANVLATANAARAIVKVLVERGGDLAPTRFDFDDEPEQPLTPDAVAAVTATSRKMLSLYFKNDLGDWSHLVTFQNRDPGAR